MESHGKPSFIEWLNSESGYKCDAYVLCTDGTEQWIVNCNFNYGIATGDELITKRGHRVKDFFFVHKILVINNFRGG